MSPNRAAKEFGRAFVYAIVSAEPADVSALWFLWSVQSSGGTKRAWEIEDAAQDRRIVGGAMQVCERIADTLRGDYTV